MALTLSQKILARTSGGSPPRPGDIVIARVDRAMSYDAYAGLSPPSLPELLRRQNPFFRFMNRRRLLLSRSPRG